jgi:hypothetical protein
MLDLVHVGHQLQRLDQLGGARTALRGLAAASG